MEENKTPRASLVDSLAKLAEECDVGQAFNEMVFTAKKSEGHAINRAGLRRQIEYLVSTYPLMPSAMEKAAEELEGAILDNARRGKTVSCSICGAAEFESKAFIHGRQQYICRRCHKDQ
jgi:hypothetical protein